MNDMREPMTKKQDTDLARLFNRIGPVKVSAGVSYWHVSIHGAEDIAYEGPELVGVLTLMIEEWPEIMDRLREREFNA